MKNSLASLYKGFDSLSSARKMSVLVTAVLTICGIVLLVYLANQVEYGVLFSNLSTEDAGSIVAKLQEKKIPYKVSASGDVVSVPVEKVSDLRLEMASSGLPQGGGVGFEIFDKKNLGATEFEQQLNYRRALQGELARTINSLDEITTSRVHIAIPKDSLFLDDRSKATASVTLKLKPGRALRPPQIDGIAHLVAGSVSGLNPADVMIIDSQGNILSKNQADGKTAGMTNSQIDYQRGVEKDLASRIQTLLESAVGQGSVAARVSAEIDFRLTEKTEETYDSESPVVRSMQKQTERTTSPQMGKSASGGSDKEKVDEVVNYEINKVTNKTVMPTGEIKKLSIAVLVDGTYSKDGTFQERPRKELETLEDLVRKSAGFNAGRGDQVVVSCMPFKNSAAAIEDSGDGGVPWRARIAGLMPAMIKYAFLLIAALASFILVIRPLLKMLLSKEGHSKAALPLFPSESGIEGGAERPPLPLGMMDMKGMNEADLARQLATQDSKKFAELLRTWIK